MDITYLKSRTHRILEAIIQAYAESAAPVGSHFLGERFSFGVSSATIRNVMAELEAQGLVTHPHTSAGRVPTDQGYRYYVDLLMEQRSLRPDEEEAFSPLQCCRADTPHPLLEQAATLLADLTGEAGVVLVPQLASGSFRHLELIPVKPNEIVGVLISSEGMVKHAVLELEEPIDREELARLERFLNEELAGMSLDQVYSHLEQSLLETNNDFFFLFKRAMSLFRQQPFLEDDAAVLLEGASRVLEAPEFRDIQRTRRLIRGLEQREELAELLRRDLSADGVKLHIGSENRGTSLTDCSIVAAPYRLRGGVRGAIGVLGPTRMDYPRVTALVARTAQAVSKAFRERGE